MKSKAVKPVSEADLAVAFEGLGHKGESARIAARGRGGVRESGSLVLGARGRSGIREAVTSVAGLPAVCFAWVPDPADPTTWKMQISRSADTGTQWSPDEDLVRAAVAQLPGVATFGKALDIPDADLPAVRAALRSAWIACGADIAEMPPELTQEALRAAFRKLGLSDRAASVAVRGRRR
jgi:hypothetical protein